METTEVKEGLVFFRTISAIEEEIDERKLDFLEINKKVGKPEGVNGHHFVYQKIQLE